MSRFITGSLANRREILDGSVASSAGFVEGAFIGTSRNSDGNLEPGEVAPVRNGRGFLLTTPHDLRTLAKVMDILLWRAFVAVILLIMSINSRKDAQAIKEIEARITQLEQPNASTR